MMACEVILLGTFVVCCVLFISDFMIEKIKKMRKKNESREKKIMEAWKELEGDIRNLDEW